MIGFCQNLSHTTFVLLMSHNGFVSDLQGLLQMKKSRHEVAEDNKLLRKELCHLIIYLVARIDIGCVTDNIVRVVLKLLKVSDKDKHNPEELWAQGISAEIAAYCVFSRFLEF